MEAKCGGRKYVPDEGTRQSSRTKWSGNEQSTQESIQGDDCKMFKEFREWFDEKSEKFKVLIKEFKKMYKKPIRRKKKKNWDVNALETIKTRWHR